MKYAIIGAGGTGGILGFYMTKAGKDVTLIARGRHLAAMQESGLAVEKMWDGTTETIPVKAADMDHYSERPDVILVCVKGYSLEDTIPFIQRVANPSTIVIPVLNIYGTGAKMQDRDIVAASIDYKDCVVQVFFIRNGKMIGREHYHMRLAGDEKRSEIITDFIKQYYAGTPYIPPEIMLQENLIDEELIGRWLTERAGHNVKFLVPKRGQKEKLVELAEKNANMVLNQDREKILKEEARTTGAVKEIERLTGLHDIHRMEAFDISNISGAQPVGSMVVFTDGRPRKNDYRKFRIKTVTGPDDYSSMREVLTRRLTHESDSSFDIKPDLIMMDGGKGQVNIALEVLNDLNISIPVCGMVKDDNHRTRALWYNGEEVEINTGSEAFKLITRIQDEAHRFAIEFHRNLRSREQVKSILDDIDGIGPVRRKALMKHFKDIDVIKKASVEELCDVPSMNLAAAEKVHEFFNKQERGT